MYIFQRMSSAFPGGKLCGINSVVLGALHNNNTCMLSVCAAWLNNGHQLTTDEIKGSVILLGQTFYNNDHKCIYMYTNIMVAIGNFVSLCLLQCTLTKPPLSTARLHWTLFFIVAQEIIQQDTMHVTGAFLMLLAVLKQGLSCITIINLILSENFFIFFHLTF